MADVLALKKSLETIKKMWQNLELWQNAKNTWDYLNGKKTVIGMLLMLVAQGSQAFFPQLMTPEQITFINTTGALIGGFGVLHKGAKSQAGQDILTKIKQKGN